MTKEYDFTVDARLKFNRQDLKTLNTRQSDEWRDALIRGLTPYMQQREPIMIRSTSSASRYPMVDTVLVTELTPAKLTVKKLVGSYLERTGSPKEVSYTYDTVYGIEKPTKTVRTNAVINMKRYLQLEPATEFQPSPAEAKAEAARKTKGADLELYLGLQYERAGFIVEYHGLQRQLEDQGIDLLVRSLDGKEILLIQAKNWTTALSAVDIININRNFDAFQERHGLIEPKPIKVIAYTKEESIPTAERERMNFLGVHGLYVDLPKSFPRVKCAQLGALKVWASPESEEFYGLQLALADVGFTVDSADAARDLGFALEYRRN